MIDYLQLNATHRQNRLRVVMDIILAELRYPLPTADIVKMAARKLEVKPVGLNKLARDIVDLAPAYPLNAKRSASTFLRYGREMRPWIWGPTHPGNDIDREFGETITRLQQSKGAKVVPTTPEEPWSAPVLCKDCDIKPAQPKLGTGQCYICWAVDQDRAAQQKKAEVDEWIAPAKRNPLEGVRGLAFTEACNKLTPEELKFWGEDLDQQAAAQQAHYDAK